MKIKLPKAFFPDKDEVILVAIDPGGSIGVAMALFGRLDEQQWDAKFCTRVYKWPQQAQELRDIELTLADVVIVEKWVLFRGKALQLSGNDLPGPQVVGFIRGELQILNKSDLLIWQTPQDKEHTDIEIIRNWFGEAWGKTEHQKDAARHLIYYLQRGKFNV